MTNEQIEDYISHARRMLTGYEPRPLHAPHAMEAAVLILLYELAETEHVLFTVRTSTVEHHKGQISFPGGGRHNPEEDLAVTALRETWEEVGILPDHIELIGRLDDFLTNSNFIVAPYVGVLHQTPYDYRPSPIEVAEVLDAPLRHLLNPVNMSYETRERPDGSVWYSPEYFYNDYRIWGATARMFKNFLETIGAAPRDAGMPGAHDGHR